MSFASLSRTSSASTPKEPKFVSIASDFDRISPRSTTDIFVSTFRALPGRETLLRHELERLVTFTRRENNCVFCDLFRLSADNSVFVIHSVWSGRAAWLRNKGWQGHPAGIGLLDQCLAGPVDVAQMEEIA